MSRARPCQWVRPAENFAQFYLLHMGNLCYIHYEMSHESCTSLTFSCVITRGALHRERRQFLRGALKELFNVLEDEPGLLGPKVEGMRNLNHFISERYKARKKIVVTAYFMWLPSYPHVVFFLGLFGQQGPDLSFHHDFYHPQLWLSPNILLSSLLCVPIKSHRRCLSSWLCRFPVTRSCGLSDTLRICQRWRRLRTTLTSRS